MDGESIDEERNRDIATSKGCLIDFDKLKVGDKLYSILHGVVEVETLQSRDSMFPIICKDTLARQRSFTLDGKAGITNIGPSLFTENPYTFAMKKMKYLQQIAINITIQNGELWEKLNQKTGDV